MTWGVSGDRRENHVSVCARCNEGSRVRLTLPLRLCSTSVTPARHPGSTRIRSVRPGSRWRFISLWRIIVIRCPAGGPALHSMRSLTRRRHHSGGGRKPPVLPLDVAHWIRSTFSVSRNSAKNLCVADQEVISEMFLPLFDIAARPRPHHSIMPI
jgi:hypothetical protein